MQSYAGRLSIIAFSSMLLGSCGGDDSQTPAPTATATPTPTPTPTPTATPSPTPSSSLFGEAAVGQSPVGYISCQSGTFTRDGFQRMTSITSLASSDPTYNPFTLYYQGIDQFGIRVGNTDGPKFEVQEKAMPRIAAYEYYKESNNNEFEIYRPSPSRTLKFSTVGRYSGDSLCFFSAGGGAFFYYPPKFSSDVKYDGIADGVAQVGGATYRLLGSQASGTLSLVANGSFALGMKLQGRKPVFDETSPWPVTDLVQVSGIDATLDNRGSGVLSLSGSGYSGFANYQISGGDQTSGGEAKSIVLVYRLRNAAGDQLYGSAALERPVDGP